MFHTSQMEKLLDSGCAAMPLENVTAGPDDATGL